MNKENKFRIWNNGQMIHAPNRFSSDLGPYITLSGLLYTDGVHQKDMILMQLSPIKDIDDQEIYEGDIIRYNPFNSLEEPITSICPPLSYFHWWSDLEMMLDFDNKCEIEVIGNIHVNQELLNIN